MKTLIIFLNLIILPIEIILKNILPIRENNRKVIFLFGNYASSTTLFFQLISSISNVNYINNVTSKFFITIYFGQLVSKFLSSFFTFKSNFYSNDGITYGFLEPNEFGWFWRKYFWKGKENFQSFERDINLFTQINKKSFIFKYSMHRNNKSLISNYKYLKKIENKLIIVYPYRPKRLVINSILNRRKNLRNYKSSYKLEMKKDEFRSVKNQVDQIYEEHRLFLRKFDKKKILKINFTKFKKNKKKEIDKIKTFLRYNNIDLKTNFSINQILKNLRFKKDIKKI